MSNMSGSDLYNYIMRTFIRTDKSVELYEAITDTLIDMRIRFAFDEFQVESYTDGIDTLGEYYFGLPSNFGHLMTDVKIIDDDDSYVLNKLSKAQFDRKYPNPNYTSVTKEKPVDFCVFGDQIYLGPVPDKLTYQYEFSYTEEDFDTIDANTTSVDFTERYREVVKAGALFRVFRDLDDDEKALKWGNIHEAGLLKIEMNDRNNQNAPESMEYCGF